MWHTWYKEDVQGLRMGAVPHSPAPILRIGNTSYKTCLVHQKCENRILVVLGRLYCEIFLGSKMGPFHKSFHKGQKKFKYEVHGYATQNGAVSSHIFLNSSLTRRP